ncbi:MAG: TIGR03862 family flavoprotein [Phyllobacterium sp.]|uniref:TIGR03862 family flavoprotein n=1 Tax=Phyllobacterium sp. TaxID=1871046 RepID=UPI0030F15E33
MSNEPTNRKAVAIIGGGPAGLMAADVLSASGTYAVTIYDSMPTFGRKFLLAGKSGLNITHSEDYERFAGRFGAASERLRLALDGFTPNDIRQWAAELGTETFIGSSGRVFPMVMKASPLLRAWLARLQERGVKLKPRHRWTGFAEGGYAFETPEGSTTIHSDAALLALGGASWPKLGSDGRWQPLLAAKDVPIATFRAANCGFDVAWDDGFRDRFAGVPVKSVTVTSDAGTLPGEFVITASGIEGSLVYAHAAALRDRLEDEGHAELLLDLVPGRGEERLARDLARQDAKASFTNRLRKGAGIEGVKAALVRANVPPTDLSDPQRLAIRIKNLPLRLVGPRPIAEAISSAGGIEWEGIDANYMLKSIRGVFVAGEMLDWEAPTGGYLLTACFATGRAAAHGMLEYLSD